MDPIQPTQNTYIIFPGTLADRGIAVAIAGSNFPTYEVTLHGFADAIQSPRLAPKYVRDDWEGGYVGASFIVPVEGESAKVVVMGVPNENLEKVKEEIAWWNGHEDDWHEFCDYPMTGFEGDIINFLASEPVNKSKLRRVTAAERESPRFQRFKAEMRTASITLREERNKELTAEGAKNTNKEQFHPGGERM